MGYRDDLKSDNWAMKRLEIMERDGSKCKKCDLERPVLRGLVKSFGILTYLEFIAKGSDFNFGKQPENYDSLKFINDNYLNEIKYIGDRNRTFELNELRFSKVFHDVKFFGVIKKAPMFICFYLDTLGIENVVDLNVHHKYYIKDRKPWEYDNDALITLCVKCHQKEHESSDIIVYSEEGGELYKTVVCDKCGGSGYLHEYDYYHNGICFECGGEGSLLVDENIQSDENELPF